MANMPSPRKRASALRHATHSLWRAQAMRLVLALFAVTVCVTGCGLRCWLDGLVIHVPYEVGCPLGFHVCCVLLTPTPRQHHSDLYSINNVVCVHVGLPTLRPRSSSGRNFGLDMAVQLSCSADWKVFGLGTGTATVSVLSTVELDLRVSRNATTALPDGLQLLDQRDVYVWPLSRCSSTDVLRRVI